MGSLNFLILIAALFIGYLIGSINMAVFIGKTFLKIDVRKYYSKNAGATNTARVLGYKWGATILFFDMLKVPIGMLVAFAFSFIQTHNGKLDGHIPYFPAAVAVIVGHIFPIFLKFKGGKGVSCFIGLTWMASPYLFLIFSFIWWSLWFGFKRVSLSSLFACLSVVILCWVPQLWGLNTLNPTVRQMLNSHVIWFNRAHILATSHNYSDDLIRNINLTILFSSAMLVVAHYENIWRIINKKEKIFKSDKSMRIR